MATDYFAFVADFFYAWANFHFLESGLVVFAGVCGAALGFYSGFLLWRNFVRLVAVGYAPTLQVVGGQLYLHLVARQDTDVMNPHFARDVR